MRIISGKARGTNLYTLEGQETRPTLDRVKESVFNIIQNQIQDCIFLDVFAGSGAIGLEAASRGAKKVNMCEKSPKAVQIIKKNIDKTHLMEQITLYEGNYEIILKNKLKEKPDIVYIDPPYKNDFAIKTVSILMEKNFLKENSIVIIETDREKEIVNGLQEIEGVEIFDIRKYGRASIIFVKLKVVNE